MNIDELLTRAAGQARDEMLAELPDDAALDHQFSEAFEARMQTLSSQKPGAHKRRLPVFVRRAAVIMLAGFVGLSATVMSVEAWRVQLFEMVEKKFPEYSEISYEPVESSSAVGMAEFNLVERQPAYVPQGYVLTEQMLSPHINWSTYTTPDDDHISFHQSILGTSNSAINTEGTELVKFDLDGNVAFKMSNLGTQFVLWNDEQYSYMILTQLDMDEAIKIAESVTIKTGGDLIPKLTPDSSRLPDDYAAQDAIDNGDLVICDDRVENIAQLDRFVKNVSAGMRDIIRITDYTENGLAITKELYYDSQRIHYTIDRLSEHASEGRNAARISLEETGTTVSVYVTDKNNERFLVCKYDTTLVR